MRSRPPDHVGRTGLEVRLLRLYPRRWREKYGEEFVALLQQTGVGRRQVLDVMRAAAREWMTAATEALLHPTIARPVRRLIGGYLMSWTSTLFIGWIGVPRALSIARVEDHAFVAVLLGWAYSVSAVVHWRIFRDVPTDCLDKGAIRLVSALILAVVAITSWPIVSAMSRGFVSPAWFVINQMGLMVGMPARIEKAMQRTTPGLTPRPPSITTLGLSA
jgi:hypothetical protein